VTAHLLDGRNGVEEREFVAGSRPVWERLAAAVQDARAGGIGRLGALSIKQMHEDYRHAAADLAYAQTHFAGGESVAYLNRLVAFAHGELYGAPPKRLSVIWRFLAAGYPRLIRSNWKALAVATGIFIAAVALGFLLVYVDYPVARLLLPPAYRDTVGDSMARGENGNEAMTAVAPLLSAYITANNIQVSLLAFAGGVLFGVLTAYALVMNGLLLGVLAGAFTKAGGAVAFWSLIVPHGAIELPAIMLAGAAGLLLARALWFPGDLPRLAALRAASGDAVRLVLGVIPLLVIAGLIEGFLTPRDIDPMLKLAFGGLAFFLLAVYVVVPGRTAKNI
jgi:uncharacterized membrane protein SpoIIM required for sporulation